MAFFNIFYQIIRIEFSQKIQIGADQLLLTMSLRSQISTDYFVDSDGVIWVDGEPVSTTDYDEDKPSTPSRDSHEDAGAIVEVFVEGTDVPAVRRWARDLLDDKLEIRFKNQRVRGSDIFACARNWCQINKVEPWWIESSTPNGSAQFFHKTTNFLHKERRDRQLWYIGSGEIPNSPERAKSQIEFQRGPWVQNPTGASEENKLSTEELSKRGYYEIEEILDEKKVGKETYVLVHWKGHDDAGDHTWESAREFRKVPPIWNAWTRKKRKREKSEDNIYEKKYSKRAKIRTTNNSLSCLVDSGESQIPSVSARAPTPTEFADEDSVVISVAPPGVNTSKAAKKDKDAEKDYHTGKDSDTDDTEKEDEPEGVSEVRKDNELEIPILDAMPKVEPQEKTAPPPVIPLSVPSAASLGSTIIVSESGKEYPLDVFIRAIMAESTKGVIDACIATKNNLLQIETELLRARRPSLGVSGQLSWRIGLAVNSSGDTRDLDISTRISRIRQKIAALDGEIAKVMNIRLRYGIGQ